MTRAGFDRLFDSRSFKIAITLLSVLCAAPSGCGGGGGSSGIDDPSSGFNPPAHPPLVNLTVADVTNIILQATHEATARGKPSTIAVVDRVGNVLAVSQMAGAPANVTVTSNRGVTGGLEGVNAVTAGQAAISKAVTGAYLSSQGNAFTTRTASQIVQENFNPSVTNQPGGPLFGVQFSQLPCGDFTKSQTGGGTIGPFRTPVGLSADSGGLPIYKAGTPVGGIGVVSKTTYTLDANIFDFDVDDDEVIAIAGQVGFQPPGQIQASNISVGGLTLRYTDATGANLATSVAAIGTLNLVSVTGFYTAGGGVVAGQAYGTNASGIRPDGGVNYPGQDVYVFDDGTGTQRFAPTAGSAPAAGFITAAEAKQLTASALNIAFSARAQIRIPSNSYVQVTVAVVDLDGNILSMARTPDAPIFGADVSLQKARSAVFFSRADAQGRISGITAATNSAAASFASYMTRSQTLISGTAFADGVAFSARAIGNVARPFYPDGINANGPGSLSLAFPQWSPFTDGLQLDLVRTDIVNNGIGGAAPPASGCARFGGAGLPLTGTGANTTQLANGMQIFAGGVPIFRGTTLIGALGVSGDGIDQDDMVSFLGVQNGPSTLSNAPVNVRADTLIVNGVRLRYVNCPFAPFLNSGQQNPCP